MKSNENGSKSQRKGRSKPARSIRVLEQPTVDTDGWGAIEIRVGNLADRYLVHFIPSDFGFGATGFEVEKLDADLSVIEQYHVHLSDRPEACSCDCRGFERWSRCKHCDGLKKLSDSYPRLYTARDARREPEPQEPPQLDEVAYFDPTDDFPA